MFPPPTIVSLVLSKLLAEHVTSQFMLLILVASCQMEAPWLPTVFNILEDIPYWCPTSKDLSTGVLVGCVFKGLPLPHLILDVQR